MDARPNACVYGAPLPDLAEVSPYAVQVSPLIPGAERLEDLAQASLDEAVIAAPPGTLERRYALALALRALKPGTRLVAMGSKEKGGSRLGKELQAFGCAVVESGRRHQRLCETRRPEVLAGIDQAITEGGPRFVEALGLWSQPGLFSWDRPDPGSERLIKALAAAKPLSGKGIDLGCGPGLLARTLLAHAGVTRLDLVDLDRRAIDAVGRSFDDPRVGLHWADARHALPFDGLDFVVMNPPFHDDGAEDKGLGQGFIRQAHAVLRKGGVAWIVANRHLPYERVLTPLFSRVEVRADGGGYKVFESRK